MLYRLIRCLPFNISGYVFFNIWIAYGAISGNFFWRDGVSVNHAFVFVGQFLFVIRHDH